MEAKPKIPQRQKIKIGPSVLFADADTENLEFVRKSLDGEGYHVEVFEDGIEAIASIEKSTPDLIVASVNLPRFDGLAMCRYIRAKEDLNSVSFLLLSDSNSIDSEVLALDTGADDFISKPFSSRQLVSRVRALLRGKRKQPAATIRFGDYVIDRRRFVVLTQDGDRINLPRKEFELLFWLATNRGRVFSRESLLRQVWGEEASNGTRTVDVHVHKLRQKLGDDLIETVRGVGYRLIE